MNRVFSLAGKNIWVAGHKGLVGSAFVRRLEDEDCTILTSGFNLIKYNLITEFIEKNKIDCIIMAAAKVGGIHANATYPADFIYENLTIQNNLIHAAHEGDVKHLLFLGSSCIYPRDCAQPMREDMMMSGPLEPTNAPYAIAKLAGIEMIKAYRKQYGRHYISVMPTNLYGPNDNFHPENAHVPAALLRRIHEAKSKNAPSVTIWGSGTPKREFMHVDDMVDACVFLLQNYDDDAPINIGSGEEISIANFATLLAETIGYENDMIFDTSKPDGTPRKLLDYSRLKSMGWSPSIPLKKGLVDYYQWFLDNQNNLREK
jgi:GDP-L-fucose synthase